MADNEDTESDSSEASATSTAQAATTADRGLGFDMTGITGGSARTVNVAGIVEGNVGCVMSDHGVTTSVPTTSVTSAAESLPTLPGDPPRTMVGITGGQNNTVNMAGVVINNVRGQSDDYLKQLEDTTMEDANNWSEGMVRVTSLDTVLNKLRAGVKWVTITGCPGEGKTTLGYMSLRELKAEGYRVFNIETPEDFYKVKRSCKNSVVMFNDILGSFSFDKSRLSEWEKVIQTAVKDHNKAKGTSIVVRVVFVARNNVLEIAKSHLGECGKDILNVSNKVDLSKKLSMQEKLEILRHHLQENQIHIDNGLMKRVAASSSPHGFPHCCEMFTKLREQHGQDIDIVKFFNHPLEFLDLTTNVLAERPNCLTLFKEMLARDGRIDSTTIVDEEKRCQIKTAIKELNTSYLRKNYESVQFSHPSIHESVGRSVAEKDDVFFVTNASLTFLQQTVKLVRDGEEKAIGLINLESIPNLVDIMASRLRPNVHAGNFDIVHSRLCDDETFCRRLFSQSEDTHNKVCLGEEGKDGYTLLMDAAMAGKNVAVQVLLENGADVNYYSNHLSNYTLNLLSEIPFRMTCFKLIVDNGADIHQTDRNGNTPLNSLCTQSFYHFTNIWTERIKYLLERGANPNIPNDIGQTPLHGICYDRTPDNHIEY